MLYNSVNQLYVYIYPFTLEPLSHLTYPPPLGCHSTELSFLGFTEALHSILRMVVCICQCYSLNLSHPLLSPMSTSLHVYICISIPVLQID